MLPEKVPADAGAKPTVKAEEPPAGMESGRTSPEEVNPVPAREACVTVRVAVPVLRMEIVWLPFVPTVILPKLTFEGVTAICGCMPAPLKIIVAGELVAVLTTLMLPATAPTAVGAKFAVSGRL